MTTPFLTNAFESPYKGREIREHITNPNIIAGRFSYYSGWYHGHGFDHCARYLMPDRDDVDRLIIGSFCAIGTGAAFIMAGNQGHRADWISTFPFFWWTGEPAFAGAENGYRPAGDTVIGSDVWIGAEAVIMPGITIGHGAVIATRAVVTRDVAPYTIVAGNPARPVRQRFDDDAVAMLLEMAWWDWPLDEIRQAMPLLCSGDVAGLYGLWRNARQA